MSICFEKKLHADILLENRSYLPRGVYVDHEYPNEIEDNRRLLKPILHLVRSKPEYQGKCKLVEDVLIIKGTRYTVNTLNSLPDDLSGFEASSKSSQTTIGFFGELNPLSNFHPCRFNVADVEYKSTEQFIQSEKAKFFKDKTTVHRIMAASNPLECKRLGKNTHGYDHTRWSEVAKKLVLPGIMSKFVSNPNLASMLISTGTKKLVECCYDTLWGTGVPITDKDCLKEKYWKGTGILGECLMEVRDELTNSEYHKTQLEQCTFDSPDTMLKMST